MMSGSVFLETGLVSMIASIVLLAIAAVAGWSSAELLLTRAVARAHATGLLDHPSERGSHSIATPRVGGAAVAPVTLGAVVLVLGVCLLSSDIRSPRFASHALAAALAGGALAAWIGRRDDVRGLSVGAKLAGQVLAAGIVALLLGRRVAWGVGGWQAETGAALSAAGVFCAVLLMMNVVNFMDGMDGLASSFALICLAGIVLMGWRHGAAPALFVIPGASLGALAAFHRRNTTAVQRDKTFLGDCGSQFLGLVLPVLAVVFGAHAMDGVDLTPALILFFPFLFDSLVTIGRRLGRGANVLEAHHEHLYQRQLELGDSHSRVRRLWLAIMAIHGTLAVVVILAGSGSLGGRLALVATPVPMLYYLYYVWRREERER
jgi:UDP-N-acetylmuramyl pentapeptide phosphotransferase/UDP-N-acetylglucosamine-1-phosphate transferase